MTNITEIRGVIFRSQKEAAQWAGVTPSAISTRLSHTGTLERVGLNLSGGQIGNQANAKPLTLGKIWSLQLDLFSRNHSADALLLKALRGFPFPWLVLL